MVSSNKPESEQVIRAGVSVDSRTISPGQIYFALPGARVDGHSFLEQVASKGVKIAFVNKSYQGPHHGMTLIPVDDVLLELQSMAQKAIENYRPRIVAVTGSMGKTTTKGFIATLLAKKYRVAATPGNSNSQIGIPLAILNTMSKGMEIAVIEMGMTHPGNISKLIQIAPPEVAVITKVGLVHAINFENIEGIVQAKAEIMGHPETKMGILDYEIPNLEKIKAIGNYPKTTFSTSCAQADYFLKKHEGQIQVTAPDGKKTLPLLQLPGDHNLHNLLSAITVARYFDVSWEQIAEAIPTLELPERRLQIVEKYGITFVNDSYNANEISIKAALGSMPEPISGGRKIAVIAEIPEMGKFSENCHYEVGKCALKHVEKLFCLGDSCRPMVDLWKKENRPCEWFNDRDQLIKFLRSELRKSDVVLVKGANVKQMWKVVEEI